MEDIIKQYGPIIITVVILVAIIGIITVVLVVNKDTVAGWFTSALESAINKLQANMP